jgi:hypothetical protein
MNLTSNRVRLPKATYTAVAMIGTEDTSIVADATIVLDRATTTTLDARVSKPVSQTPPATDATAVLSEATVQVGSPNRSHGIGTFRFGTFDGVYVGQSDPAERQPLLTTSINSQWVKGPGSSHLYNLAEFFADRAPAGFTRRYTDRDLGRLHATYAGQGPTTGFTSMHAVNDEGDVSTRSAVLPVALPGKRTEYYTPNHSWHRYLEEDNLTYEATSWQRATPTRFQAGRTTSERINQAVFGPGFGIGYLGRWQDQLTIRPSQHAPAGGWSAYSPTATGRILVERAGTVIHDQPGIFADLAGVPAEEAPFRVKVDLDRGAPSRLSTHVSAEWTFRSGATTGPYAVKLPLSAVRFAPPLSDTNTAPAGRTWVVPVSILQQPGSTAGTAKTLTVDVSYDDGRTWRSVPVVRSGQQGVIALKHPATAGFVSLRAASTDSAGNTVKQTIIRAYEIV